MKTVPCLVLSCFSAAILQAAYAAPAGTVLFAQPGAAIISEGGASRPATRGEVLQAGERLVTPANGISQIVMPDGSLLGVRPGSELRFELPAQASDAAKSVVSLLQGSTRVIGAELMDSNKLSTISLRSGNAVVQMRAADLEAATVKAGSTRDAEGSYQRLLTGTANVGVGQSISALSPRQVSYVGTTAIAPVFVSSISPTLFASSTLITSPLTTSLLSTTSPKTLPGTNLLSPTVTTSTLTAPTTTLTATTVAPITTTYVAPTLTYVTPTMTSIAPTTTYIAPTTSTISTLSTSTTLKTISSTSLTCRLKGTC